MIPIWVVTSGFVAYFISSVLLVVLSLKLINRERYSLGKRASFKVIAEAYSAMETEADKRKVLLFKKYYTFHFCLLWTAVLLLILHVIF
ncbi:MAG: hypothetical protein NT150_01485 [Bacteroidetes bacterium]|nr:hypothetical protein [Bacteroidota bacterium]